jgi:uncharacterized membrane protein YkvA (DUF1232 family)/DNA-binding Xre family transcriptional regulator
MLYVTKESDIGLLLTRLLKQQSLSMKKLSELTDIDPATISRIIHGKRKATPNHLQKFADVLEVPISELFAAAGYPINENIGKQYSDDFHSSINSILEILKCSKAYNKTFTMDSVKQQLDDYTQYAQTKEGRESILKNFEKKLQKVGSIGPFIDHLKDMFLKFSRKQGTPFELALMGGALLYFISPVDVIPDYIFPIGYLDDALVVSIVLNILAKRRIKKK